MYIKLTEAQKKVRKERRRTNKIKYRINNLGALITFHDLYDIVGDDGSIKIKEVAEANRKIAELEKQI